MKREYIKNRMPDAGDVGRRYTDGTTTYKVRKIANGKVHAVNLDGIRKGHRFRWEVERHKGSGCWWIDAHMPSVCAECEQRFAGLDYLCKSCRAS